MPDFYKVVVKRTIVLTTEFNFPAFNRWDAAKVARVLHMTPEVLGSLQSTVQSWIETCPQQWKFEGETDSIASIHKGKCIEIEEVLRRKNA